MMENADASIGRILKERQLKLKSLKPMQRPRFLPRPVLLQSNRARTTGPRLLSRIMERHYGCLLWLKTHL